MEETKRCPYCGEEILISAKKCKFCHEWLDDERKEAKQQEKDIDEGDDSWGIWIKIILVAAIIIAALLTVPSEEKHENKFYTSMSELLIEDGSDKLGIPIKSNEIVDGIPEVIARSKFALKVKNCYLFSYGVARNKETGDRAIATIGAFGIVISFTSIFN